MILDERNEFLDATALNTGAPGNFVLGDQIDLGVAGRDLFGEDLWLVVRVATTATSGGAATLQVHLLTADNAALTTNAVAIASSAVVALAALVAGATVFAVKLPFAAYKRFIGIRQTTGTAAFTGGAIDAFLTSDPNAWRAYADAV